MCRRVSSPFLYIACNFGDRYANGRSTRSEQWSSGESLSGRGYSGDVPTPRLTGRLATPCWRRLMRAAGLSRRAAEPTHVAAPLDPLMVPRPKHVSEVRSMGSMYKSTSADRLSLCPDPRASQPSRYAAVRDISRVVPTPKPSAPPHSGRIARGPVLLRIERFFRSQYVPAIEAKNRRGACDTCLTSIARRARR